MDRGWMSQIMPDHGPPMLPEHLAFGQLVFDFVVIGLPVKKPMIRDDNHAVISGVAQLVDG